MESLMEYLICADLHCDLVADEHLYGDRGCSWELIDGTRVQRSEAEGGDQPALLMRRSDFSRCVTFKVYLGPDEIMDPDIVQEFIHTHYDVSHVHVEDPDR